MGIARAGYLIGKETVMTEIRPRWGGVHLEGASGLQRSGWLGSLLAESRKATRIYLLSGAGEGVKVRDALMDITGVAGG